MKNFLSKSNFVLVLTLAMFCLLYFDFTELGKYGILELVTDPIFYMILVGVALLTLIIMFILDKIFPAK